MMKSWPRGKTPVCRLEEYCQKLRLKPSYVFLNHKGSWHACVKVTVGEVMAIRKGSTEKAAKNSAAQAALKALKGIQNIQPTAVKGIQNIQPTAVKGIQDIQPTALKGIQDSQPTAQKGIQGSQPTAMKGIQNSQSAAVKGIQGSQPIAHKGIQDSQPTAQKGIQDSQPNQPEKKTTMKVEAGSMDLGGLSFEVQKLLFNKSVIILGDSNHRGVYKDLVLLLQKNDILSGPELRKKGELSFRNDCLLRGGVKGNLNNEVTYMEEREYSTQHHRVRFYFITRCYNSYVEAILQEMALGTPPDLVIMNSCLWDLTRYGSNGMSFYRDRLAQLCGRLVGTLRPGTQFLWTTTLPIAKQPRGGFLTPEVQLQSRRLTLEVMQANYVARNILGMHGLRYLDLESWLHSKVHLRGKDGVHWCGEAHRYISELLLTMASHQWGEGLFSFAPCLLSCPFIMPRGPSVGERSMGEEGMRQYGHVPHHTMATPYRRPAPYHVPVARPVFQRGCGQMSTDLYGNFSRRCDRIPPGSFPWRGNGILHNVNNGFNSNLCANQQTEILDDSGFVNDDFGPFWWEEQDSCMRVSFSNAQKSKSCTSVFHPQAHSTPGKMAPASRPVLSQAAPSCLPAVHQGSSSCEPSSCYTPAVTSGRKVTVKVEPLSFSEESPAVSQLSIQIASSEVLHRTIKSEPLSPCQQLPDLHCGNSESAPSSQPTSVSWSSRRIMAVSRSSAQTYFPQSSSQMASSSQSLIQTTSVSRQFRQTPVSQSLHYMGSFSTTDGLRWDSSQSEAGESTKSQKRRQSQKRPWENQERLPAKRAAVDPGYSSGRVRPASTAAGNLHRERCLSHKGNVHSQKCESNDKSNQPSLPALRNIKQEQLTCENKGHCNQPSFAVLRNIKQEQLTPEYKGHSDQAFLAALRNIKQENLASESKGVAHQPSLSEGGKSQQEKFTSANWRPCEQEACLPRIKQEGFAGFTQSANPVPAHFLLSWADYSQDQFVGAQRRPVVAGGCENPGHQN